MIEIEKITRQNIFRGNSDRMTTGWRLPITVLVKPSFCFKQLLRLKRLNSYIASMVARENL